MATGKPEKDRKLEPPPVAVHQQVREFLDRAAPILAVHRGLNSKSWGLLNALGSKLGLSEEQIKQAIRTRQTSATETVSSSAASAPPLPPQPPAKPSSSASSTSPPNPTPTPTPIPPPAVSTPPSSSASSPVAPPRPPRDAFCDSVRKLLAQLQQRILNAKAENQLVAMGQRKYKLSEAFARHLVYEVAETLRIRLLSQEQAEKAADDSTTADEFTQSPQIKAFLKKAGLIIAEQRGINVQSRVRLGALAKDLGLSDEEMKQAIASLQKSEANTDEDSELDPQLRERLDSYRQYLQKHLVKLADGVITAPMEQSLIVAGVERHGVPTEQVASIIREVATQYRIRFITQAQATEHLVRLVEESVEPSQRVNDKVRHRLQAEGKQWGLTEIEVDGIIRQRYGEAHREERRRQRRNVWLLGATAMVCVALIGVLAWAVYSHKLFSNGEETDNPPIVVDDDVSDNPSTDVSGGGGSEGTKKKAPEFPAVADWWDTSLTADIVLAQGRLPHYAPTLKRLSAPDPKIRAAAYEKLMQIRRGRAESNRALALLEGVVVGCYQRDPSEECATKLRESLLAIVPEKGSVLPKNTGSFRRAYWAVETALAIIFHREKVNAKLSKEEQSQRAALVKARADAMTEALARRLHLPPMDSSTGQRAVSRQALSGLTSHLYQVLLADAHTHPRRVAPLLALVSKKSRKYLGIDTYERLDTQLAVTVAPLVGDDWTKYQDILSLAINASEATASDSPETQNLVRVLELYERKELNDALTQFLTPLLRQRAGLFNNEATPEQVATALRKRLGIVKPPPPVTAEERWEQFRQRAESALAKARTSSHHRDQLLKETQTLNRVATLGCALAQKELGFKTFDDLLTRDSERTKRASTPPPATVTPPVRRLRPRRSEMSRHQNNMIDEAVRMLANRRLSAYQRSAYFLNLSKLAKEVKQVSPKQGDAIAQYVLRKKTTPEHTRITLGLPTVLTWRTVQLGLADHIEKARLRPRYLTEVLSTALGREIKYEAGDAWRKTMRLALLQNTLDHLKTPKTPIGPTAAKHPAQQSLHEEYCTQARLWSVPGGIYKATESPGQVLRLVIDQYAKRFSTAKSLRPADRDYLASLPHQFTVTEYLANDDLRQTVLYQRIWLRLLAMGVVQNHPDRATAADKLVTDLHHTDATTKDPVTQLRDGEAKILQMWLLWNQP